MEEAKFSPSESGLQRKTELRSVHSFHQNAMPFAPCATQGPKETLFCSLRNAGPRKRPFFAPCVTQGSERHPFLLPALRRVPKDDAFQAGANKKSVQTVAARTLSSMLSLKSKILMPVASWSGHTCQRSQQPWRHRRLRLPRCRPESAACGSSVHRHSPA